MKILVLSPYDAMSHQYWRERLKADLESSFDAEIEVLILPPRYFSWRFRGNSLSFAHDSRLNAGFDLIIATSMTDLAALKGMAPVIARVPSVLYFHENQFAYPDQTGGQTAERQLERQITSIYSAVAADALVFNSEFNRSSFLHGAGDLLNRMPDAVPPGIVDALRQKSRIISVPIDSPELTNSPERINSPEQTNHPRHPSSRQLESDPISLVWNHRWEYDKGIEELHAVVAGLIAAGCKFRFHLIGQQFRKSPKQIEAICDLLGDSLGELGFVSDRAAYHRLLHNTDIVLSTARQEFQGIAVLEAMSAGCLPVVPDSLAYQEFVPASCRYQDVAEAMQMITGFDPQAPRAFELPASLSRLKVMRAWQQLVRELVQ